MDCSWTSSTHFPLNCSWGHSKCLGRTTPPGTESCENSPLPTTPPPTVEPTNADCNCQINLFKHTSDFWPSISWPMGSKWKALKSENGMEEKLLRCRGNALQSFFSESYQLCLAQTPGSEFWGWLLLRFYLLLGDDKHQEEGKEQGRRNRGRS